MRLICPNCDAEYEVDASVIPEGGRDVQCSSCGHGWFQLHAGAETATENEFEDAATDGEELFAQEAEEDFDDADMDLHPQVELAAPRALDDDVLSVLREEAERESAARRTEEPQPIETQTEFGLTAPVVPPVLTDDPAAKRIAAMKGIDPAPAMADPEKPQARRDLLPEIDEINSTLRATSERRDGEAGAVAEALGKNGRNGFRRGFVLTLLAAVVAAAVYISAPQISQKFPQTAPALTAYVQKVDAMRLWLDGTLLSLTGKIRGVTADPS